MTHQQQTGFKNIVGKEEIARNKQFLPFPQCFLLNQIIVSLFVHIFDIISLFDTELEEPKIGISGKGLTPYHTIPTYSDFEKETFLKHFGKRRKCCKQAFSPFPKMLSTIPKTNFNFSVTFFLLSANAFNLD